MKWINKYTGSLRGFRPFYGLFNRFNRKVLNRNRNLYKEYGLQKSIYSGIESIDFKNLDQGELPWLDRDEEPKFGDEIGVFDPTVAQGILSWQEKGYLTIPSFLGEEQVNKINHEIKRLRDRDQVDFNYTGKKIMQAYQQSELIKEVLNDDKLKSILNYVMGADMHLFHNINFIQGSEQAAHSDTIHMTTHPKGYLIAVWFALEDIGEDQGPLFVYPGSHKLPYVMNDDFLPNRSKYWIDQNAYKKYELHIASQIEKYQLKPINFLPKKGDVLIWHANLLHGGAPMKRKELTRKSMVAHYFAKDVICYHEISRRPALMKVEE